MSEQKNAVTSVQNFIFNDDVQDIISDINDNLMDFNILEITGMGNQEIKHSNILGWLFDDSEHNLEYQILDDFLKKVIEENKKDTLDDLQSYIYLSENKKDITIYREKDNIDLLVVDEANKVLITIENKVFANERTDGNDGGQLQKYEDIINQKYDKSYSKYFIFLTINLGEPSKENWLKASHFMITDIIQNILESKKDLAVKTTIILESYVDLLKRNAIVEDKTIEELCKKIWNNKEYSKALEVLNQYKPNNAERIKNLLANFERAIIVETKIYSGVYNFFVKLNKNSALIYNIAYSPNLRRLGLSITSKDKSTIDTTMIFNHNPRFKHYKGKDNKKITDYLEIFKEEKIANDEIDEKVNNLLNDLKVLDNNYIKSSI